MKEIGSIFPLFNPIEASKSDWPASSENEVYFSLCREGLLYIARHTENRNKTVMLPAYTCQAVIDPFIQEKWKCRFYAIGKDLRINIDSFISIYNEVTPTIVIAHPFYGRGLSQFERDLLQNAKKHGSVVVEDITQSVYLPRNEEYVDYYVGSLRKWFPAPDGGFLFSAAHRFDKTLPTEEFDAFYVPQKDAMFLRGQYFANDIDEIKQISIRLNKCAERTASENVISLHRISDCSRHILEGENHKWNQMRRIENFQFLSRHLPAKARATAVIKNPEELESSPLYFPLYAEERDFLQRRLAKEKIYAPILWPIDTEEVLIDDDVKYIYDHILLLPVDQRYDVSDMKRMLDVISL